VFKRYLNTRINDIEKLGFFYMGIGEAQPDQKGDKIGYYIGEYVLQKLHE
jgi:hypothetical protein